MEEYICIFKNIQFKTMLMNTVVPFAYLTKKGHAWCTRLLLLWGLGEVVSRKLTLNLPTYWFCLIKEYIYLFCKCPKPPKLAVMITCADTKIDLLKIFNFVGLGWLWLMLIHIDWCYKRDWIAILVLFFCFHHFVFILSKSYFWFLNLSFLFRLC